MVIGFVWIYSGVRPGEGDVEIFNKGKIGLSEKVTFE